jgi:selenocysteine-specific elongation factor
MKRLVLGVIGHVDHGKTALVRALTGMETDRLPEEKRRGISIALGFAYLAGPNMEIEIVDMPGHERFVRTMVSGATGIDCVLLVVAANEGIKPQTREHVDIAALLGIRRAVVAISKVDLVESDAAKAVAHEACVLLRAAEIHAAEPIPTSSRTGEGIESLRGALLDQLTIPVVREDRGFAWLPIDRAFSLAGYGTVVTGTLRHGGIATGDELELVPSGKPVRIRSLQVHRTSITSAQPGQRVAVNLRGIEAAAIVSGHALGTKGLLPASGWISVELRLANGASRTLRNGARLLMQFGTSQVEVRVRLLDRDVLERGETCFGQLCCAAAISVPAREHFILRTPSPLETIAGGRVLDPQAARLRRHVASVLQRLRHLAGGIPDDWLSYELQAAAGSGRAVNALARLVGLSPAKTVERLKRLSVQIAADNIVVAQSTHNIVVERVQSVLRDYATAQKPALSLAQLGAELGRNVSAGVIEIAVASLIARGEVRQDGGRLRLVRPEHDRNRARQEDELAARLAGRLLDAKLAPPDAKSIFAENPQTRQVVARLVRDGTLVRAIDRAEKREFLFHREVIRSAQTVLEPNLAKLPGLLVSDVSLLLGISRKYCIPLLQHLDAVRFTRRVGDRRVLARAVAPADQSTASSTND